MWPSSLSFCFAVYVILRAACDHAGGCMTFHSEVMTHLLSEHSLYRLYDIAL